ncbi:unnamed protein product, partial [Polarella glacialis]
MPDSDDCLNPFCADQQGLSSNSTPRLPLIFPPVRVTAMGKTMPEICTVPCGRWLAEIAERGQLAWQLSAVSGDSLEQWADQMDEETNVKAHDPNLCNPLSRNSNNPFLKIQVNEDLLREIWKDVERTFPECEFLSSAESRKVLQRMLFHWCRSMNPSSNASDSYRQGMNELVAVIFSVVKQGEYAGGSWESAEALGTRLCGSGHNEADAYILFSRLMDHGLRAMFMNSGRASARPSKSPIGDLPRSFFSGRGPAEQGPPGSAILARCQFIFDQVLHCMDEDLHTHLKKLEIEPQVFLLRWLRLLFCREFELE